MEIRALAEAILFSPDLAVKLADFPAELTDCDPGDPLPPTAQPLVPARPPELVFTDRQRGARMPHPDGLREARLRAVAHHVMANHELQALEVMAWVLLRFPEAPADFRRELVPILRDEQRHTRMHLRRLEALGLAFGARPVNGYVWRRAMAFTSLMDYLAGLPLTFEGGNLDHTLAYADLFEAAGDRQGAEVMRAIHADEIEHVRFGLTWFRRLKPRELSDWEAYLAHLRWPLRPAYAKGHPFRRQAREAAGMAPDFLDALEAESAQWGRREHQER